MMLADEIQYQMPEGVYLKMANACKAMYEVIEELDPTSVEGYSVVGDGTDFQTQEELIAELEESINTRDESLDRLQDELRAKYRELQKLNSLQASIMRNEQVAINQCEAHLNVINALEGHHTIGPHIAYSKMVSQMTNLMMAPQYVKPTNSDCIVQSVIHNMRTVHPQPWMAQADSDGKWVEIETVKYIKTEYTEGWGSSGISLVELVNDIH
jgi:uncharacterized coiled-coil protein SlyX